MEIFISLPWLYCGNKTNCWRFSAMTIACLPVGTWYISYDSSFSNFSSTMIPSKNFLHYTSLISIYSMISHQSFDTWHWITTGIISKSSVVLQAWVKHWLSFGGAQSLWTVRVTCFVQYTPLVMEKRFVLVIVKSILFNALRELIFNVNIVYCLPKKGARVRESNGCFDFYRDSTIVS